MVRKILIVDDEREVALSLIQHLEQVGYLVEFASSGEEALSLLETTRPDMLICDLRMPEIDGYQIMAATAAYLNLPDLPIILADEKWTLESTYHKAGVRIADCYISKPYVVREIALYVRRIFQSIDEDRASTQTSQQCTTPQPPP